MVNLNKEKIKLITFDLYNTLARFWPPVEEIQVLACSRLGVKVSQTNISSGYLLADTFMAKENAIYPVRDRQREERKIFFNKYEQIILQGAGIESDLQFADLVWKEIQKIPYALKLFDDVIPVLEQLRLLGYKLIILSNVDRNSDELMDFLGLRGQLDYFLTSRDIGADKPHSPIFLESLKLANVKPFEAIHIGDQFDTDILGARKVGMNTILIDRRNEYRNFNPLPNEIRNNVDIIQSLNELLLVLN
tara:strand:+ start:24282 stop:25025 length:744 start_codon:yes stop_codon:yes gene_type:complete